MNVKFVIIYSAHYSCKLLHNQQMYTKRLKIINVQNCCMFQCQGAIFREPQLVCMYLHNSWHSIKLSRPESRVNSEGVLTFRELTPSLSSGCAGDLVAPKLIILWCYQTTSTLWTWRRLVPKPSERLHILTWLSAGKYFIEYCRSESFSTYSSWYDITKMLKLQIYWLQNWRTMKTYATFKALI